MPGGFELHTRDRVARAGTVVLAYGNQAPQPVVVGDVDLADLPGHLPDPWDLAAIRALPDDAVVVLVGSGLTAIDLAITLLEDSPRRRAVMVSRHGLLPHTHIEQQSTAWVSPLPPGELTADGLAEFVRGQVAGGPPERRELAQRARRPAPAHPALVAAARHRRAAPVPRRRTPGSGRSVGTGWPRPSTTGSTTTASSGG